MAAVETPPVQEPVQEPAIEEPVAPTPEPTSPEAPEEGAGDVEAESGEDEGRAQRIAEALKDVSPEELRELIQSAPPESRDAVLAEEFRRAEQRGETRAREELQSRTAMKQAYDEGIQNSYGAQQWLTQQMGYGQQVARAIGQALDFDNAEDAKKHMQNLASVLDPNAINQAAAAIRAGAYLESSQRHSEELSGWVKKHGDLFSKDGDYEGTFTEDEAKMLDSLAYNDARTGQTKAQTALLELALQRAERRGFVKGLNRKAQKDAATLKLADKVEKITAAKAGAAPTINGRAPSAAESRSFVESEISKIKADANAGKLNQQQYEERMAEVKKRISAIQKG